MKILLTNDDGIQSPGLAALRDALSERHEVWVMAPDSEKSGTSHAITLKGAIRVRRMGEREFSCGGTPADCVLLACIGAVPIRPEMVVSGINLGPNLGTDIIYSGTAAAARQAAIMGYSAVAVSVAGRRPPFLFGAAAAYVAGNIERFRELWTPEHFLNINVPSSDQEGLEVEITHPSRRIYKDSLASFEAPDGDFYYFLNGSLIEEQIDQGSDWDAVSRGKISVTPVHLQPIRHAEYESYHDALFGP